MGDEYPSYYPSCKSAILMTLYKSHSNDFLNLQNTYKESGDKKKIDRITIMVMCNMTGQTRRYMTSTITTGFRTY